MEDEQIVRTLKSFSLFTVGSFFDAGGSAHDYTYGVARILEKEGAHALFTFKVDTLLDAEGLSEVKKEILDSLFKGGYMLMLVGAWRVLLLGTKDECDALLEAKFRTNNADVTIESEELDTVRNSVPFREGEGVTKFLLVLLEGMIVIG